MLGRHRACSSGVAVCGWARPAGATRRGPARHSMPSPSIDPISCLPSKQEQLDVAEAAGEAALEQLLGSESPPCVLLLLLLLGWAGLAGVGACLTALRSCRMAPNAPTHPPTNDPPCKLPLPPQAPRRAGSTCKPASSGSPPPRAPSGRARRVRAALWRAGGRGCGFWSLASGFASALLQRAGCWRKRPQASYFSHPHPNTRFLPSPAGWGGSVLYLPLRALERLHAFVSLQARAVLPGGALGRVWGAGAASTSPIRSRHRPSSRRPKARTLP